MPAHRTILEDVKRALAYAQVATVGVHGNTNGVVTHTWGPSGLKKAMKIAKRKDAARSHEFNKWDKFAAFFDQEVKSKKLIFSGSTEEADQLKAFIRLYYVGAEKVGQAPVVSMVKRADTKGAAMNKSRYVLIELQHVYDKSWVSVWTSD
ncbi:MAG: hypothetical protein ABIQ36_05445 [Rhodanobacter sp.]